MTIYNDNIIYFNYLCNYIFLQSNYYVLSVYKLNYLSDVVDVVKA